MTASFPFLTTYDPLGTSEGTLDPLGLYQIAANSPSSSCQRSGAHAADQVSHGDGGGCACHRRCGR
jgi:hypothetical protein